MLEWQSETLFVPEEGLAQRMEFQYVQEEYVW